MSQNSTAVVQQAYANFKTGNLDGLLALMDPSIEWKLPQIDVVRISGLRRRLAQVQEFFQSLAADQHPIAFQPREFIEQGDTVVAIGHYQWRVKSTGKPWECDFTHVFTVRNGVVTQFREFLDTAAAAASYRS